MKPVWEELHEGMIDDIKHIMELINHWEQYMIKTVHNRQKIDNEILVNLKLKLRKYRKEYKDKYGQFPKPNQLKEIL